MHKIKSIISLCSVIILLLLLFACVSAIAAEGQAQVYKKDPELTPVPQRVVLQDLDGSGYLKNPYLILLLLKGSRYDYPAYSPTGQFLYNPVPWDYNNISAEGIKFDAVSIYYYLTLARRYFQNHFGFNQSWDGETIEGVRVYPFSDDLINGSYPGAPRVTGLNPPSIIFTIPGDPHLGWAPNYNRAFSVVMHEYSHIVFLRYRQRMLFQSPHYSEADAISEGLAVFWPCTIMDEPRYGRTVWLPGIELADLSQNIKFDPTIPDQFGNMIGALTSALWSLREHPRIGKTNAEKLIYTAMRLIPRINAKLGHVTEVCIKAKPSLPSRVAINLKNAYIEGTFANNNIPRIKTSGPIFYMIFTEKEDNIPQVMKINEMRNITITFTNNSPLTVNTPVLISFNPAVNPNVDKPQVNTTYSWRAPPVINPTIQTKVPPKGKVSFNFYITAPQTAGAYSCDWAIQLDGQTGYIVSKDIIVDPY